MTLRKYAKEEGGKKLMGRSVVNPTLMRMGMNAIKNVDSYG